MFFNKSMRAMSLPAAPLTLPLLSIDTPVTWRVPGSKSLTNRAFVLAALSSGETTLRGILRSDDTLHMQRCLRQLGIESTDVDETTVTVHGGRDRLLAPREDLFVGNSGTTVRFLTALAALVPGPVTLVGDAHMAKRPIEDLLHVFDQLGVDYTCATGCPPLTVYGGSLPGGIVRMRGDRSSQYFSALLMAAGAADAELQIEIEGQLVSRPYVAMTRAIIDDFGGCTEENPHGFLVRPREISGTTITIEPDASAASYPWACALACGIPVTVPDLTYASLQGDVDFTKVLEQFGATVTEHTDADQRGLTVAPGAAASSSELTLNMHHISDTVMSIAAIAPLLGRTVTITDIANIRIKETDRLQALVNELGRLGQKIDAGKDWLRITPATVQAAHIECYADHRMAMSFAILGAATGHVTITDPACVSKTYPNFWQDLGVIYHSAGQHVPWPVAL
jgi:3-phosphoshikimate 1-carboxyvinyltransferase